MRASEDATVVVTASGTVAAEPDAVVVGLGIEVSADTPAEALRQVDARVTALLAGLDAEGVAPADRRTTGLQVHPRWVPDAAEPRGHTAAYGLEVTVSDLPGAGRLVQRAGDDAGEALRVHAFVLQVRDLQPFLARARAAAVQAASEQAQQLVAAAGLLLGPVVALREGGGDPPGVPVGRREAFLLADSGGGPPVQAGRHDVTVTVTAVFRVLDAPG
jgi:uncharacterized protein